MIAVQNCLLKRNYRRTQLAILKKKKTECIIN